MTVAKTSGQFRIVLVGHGKMGHAYATAIQAHPRLRTAGVVGRTIESTNDFRASHDIPIGFSDVGLAYDRTLADAVIIAVPPSETARILMVARTKPWKCLVEKPAGRNLEESRELLNGLHSSPWPVSVCLNRRYYPHIRNIQKKIVEDGGAAYIQARDQHTLGVEESLSAEVLFRKAIHMVDLLMFFSQGDVESCSPRLTRLGGKSFVVEALIDFSDQTRVNYVSVVNAPGRWEMSLHTYKSSWKLDPLEQGWEIQEFPSVKRPMEAPPETLGVKPGITPLLDGLVRELDTGFPVLPSLADSHKSMALLSEIFSPLGWEQ